MGSEAGGVVLRRAAPKRSVWWLPDVHDRNGSHLGLGGHVVAEYFVQEAVDDGMETVLYEAVPVLFVLPDIDVAQPAVRVLYREVDDQPLRGLVAKTGSDAPVEGVVDRHILGERERHVIPSFAPNSFRMKVCGVDEPVKKRRYDASARQAASATTRQQILNAARDLLIDHGYRRTTIASIAERAEVNVDTVYELVGRKPVLLRELIEQAISGTDHAVAAEERAYVVAIRAEPDPHAKLRIYAKATRENQQRLAPLFLALRDASTTEPEAQQVWQEISDRRAANMRLFAEDLHRTGQLRNDLPIDQVADVVWVTNSSELFVMLTIEHGWPTDRYEHWLADTWDRLLLEQ